MKGIYKLVFKGLEDWPYVGQSLDIEHRYENHLRSLKVGKSNYKLQEAFDMCGIPSIEVLEETDNLHDREIFWIKQLDSINNGLNITCGGDSSGSGYTHARSKFTREQVIQVFELLINTEFPLLKIVEITKVSISQVSSIASGTTHLWLKNEFPAQYDKLMSLPNRKALRTELRTLISPKGEEISIRFPSEYFTDEKGYDSTFRSGISGVITKNKKQYKGWRLVGNIPEEYPPLISESGEIVYLKDREVAKFSKENGLHRTSVLRVLRGKQLSTKGWRLLNSTNKNYPYPPVTDDKNIYYIPNRGISKFLAKFGKCSRININKLLISNDFTLKLEGFRLANEKDMEKMEIIRE